LIACRDRSFVPWREAAVLSRAKSSRSISHWISFTRQRPLVSAQEAVLYPAYCQQLSSPDAAERVRAKAAEANQERTS